MHKDNMKGDKMMKDEAAEDVVRWSAFRLRG